MRETEMPRMFGVCAHAWEPVFILKLLCYPVPGEYYTMWTCKDKTKGNNVKLKKKTKKIKPLNFTK